MADLTTATTHTLTLTTAELDALRSALTTALKAEAGSPAERKHWKALSRMGKGHLSGGDDPTTLGQVRAARTVGADAPAPPTTDPTPT